MPMTSDGNAQKNESSQVNPFLPNNRYFIIVNRRRDFGDNDNINNCNQVQSSVLVSLSRHALYKSINQSIRDIDVDS